MFNEETFQSDPREYALEMVDEGLLDGRALAHALLVAMSHDEVREALDANELAPRFYDAENAGDGS